MVISEFRHFRDYAGNTHTCTHMSPMRLLCKMWHTISFPTYRSLFGSHFSKFLLKISKNRFLFIFEFLICLSVICGILSRKIKKVGNAILRCYVEMRIYRNCYVSCVIVRNRKSPIPNLLRD